MDIEFNEAMAAGSANAGRHRAVYLVDAELFWQIWAEGNSFAIRVTQGIPPGAQLIRSFYDPVRGDFGAMFEHPSFPLGEVGDQIPINVIIIRSTAPVAEQEAGDDEGNHDHS